MSCQRDTISRSDEFSILFIGMDSFHWSKIVWAAIAKYHAPSAIKEALVNIYGEKVAETSVMKGGDYVKCREGMNIIFEAISSLLF